MLQPRPNENLKWRFIALAVVLVLAVAGKIAIVMQCSEPDLSTEKVPESSKGLSPVDGLSAPAQADTRSSGVRESEKPTGDGLDKEAPHMPANAETFVRPSLGTFEQRLRQQLGENGLDPTRADAVIEGLTEAFIRYGEDQIEKALDGLSDSLQLTPDERLIVEKSMQSARGTSEVSVDRWEQCMQQRVEGSNACVQALSQEFVRLIRDRVPDGHISEAAVRALSGEQDRYSKRALKECQLETLPSANTFSLSLFGCG